MPYTVPVAYELEIPHAAERFANPFHIEDVDLIDPDTPHLIVSNHPPLYRISPFIWSLSKKVSSLAVVSDAAYAPLLQKFNINAIAVHTPGKRAFSQSIVERLKIDATTALGHALNVYKRDNSQKGGWIVGHITSALRDDETVLLFPAGRSAQGAPWRPGLGKAVEDLLISDTDFRLAMAHVDRTSFRNRILTVFGRRDLAALVGNHDASRDTITQTLYDYYEEFRDRD